MYEYFASNRKPYRTVVRYECDRSVVDDILWRGINLIFVCIGWVISALCTALYGIWWIHFIFVGVLIISIICRIIWAEHKYKQYLENLSHSDSQKRLQIIFDEETEYLKRIKTEYENTLLGQLTLKQKEEYKIINQYLQM